MKNSIFKSIFGFLLLAVAFLTFNAVTGTPVENVGDTVAPTMAFAAVAKVELVERELINHFRHDATWLSVVPSKNQWVNKDVIKLNEIGADPAVLINNTAYPIAINSRTDTSAAISLFKYDTENTKITDDELYGLPYDKVGTVQRQHRETLEEKTLWHALWNLAPDADTADTPIIETTGAAVGGVGTRLRLTYADLITLKTKLDKLKVPAQGRVLVLCPDHIADLILEDKALAIQYHNHKSGMITGNFAGFELYTDINLVKYDGSKDKIAFESATAGAQASIVFHKKTTAKARGSVGAYRSDAKTDPANRETVMGFRVYFIAVPTRTKGQAAIIDGTAV